MKELEPSARQAQVAVGLASILSALVVPSRNLCPLSASSVSQRIMREGRVSAYC